MPIVARPYCRLYVEIETEQGETKVEFIGGSGEVPDIGHFKTLLREKQENGMKIQKAWVEMVLYEST